MSPRYYFKLKEILLVFAACLCLTFQLVSVGISWHQPWVYLVLLGLGLSGPSFVWQQIATKAIPFVDFRLICRSPLWQIFLATFFREEANAGVSKYLQVIHLFG